MLSTLLVIGGSGFVGKSILDAYSRGLLRNFGVLRIVVVARRATSLRDSVPLLVGPNVDLVDLDVRDLQSLFGAEMVIHAAASANATDYHRDPDTERRIIEHGTRKVLQLAAVASQPVKLLYVSSGAVYGRQSPDIWGVREDTKFENEPEISRRAYAEAKRTAEVLVQDAAQRLSLRASIARCFAFVGPWLPRDRHFAVGNFLAQGLARKSITVSATHEVIRSYMYADDMVEWLMRICDHGTVRCPIFNVGSDEAVSIHDLAAMIGGMYDVPVDIPSLNKMLPSDRYLPDVSLAKRALDVRVTIALRQALERTSQALGFVTNNLDRNPIHDA